MRALISLTAMLLLVGCVSLPKTADEVDAVAYDAGFVGCGGYLAGREHLSIDMRKATQALVPRCSKKSHNATQT